MLCIRGKPEKNPRGKVYFPIGFSRLSWARSPQAFVSPSYRRTLPLFSRGLCSPSMGPGGLTPWRRSGGRSAWKTCPWAGFQRRPGRKAPGDHVGGAPSVFLRCICITVFKHDSSYFFHSCVSPAEDGRGNRFQNQFSWGNRRKASVGAAISRPPEIRCKDKLSRHQNGCCSAGG